MENYLAQTLLISKPLLQPLCQPICCAQQMSEICVQQICNKKSKLDSDALLPNTFFFCICSIRLPKYRWLGLEEFFRKYHFIKTHDDNKNEYNNDKFCGRQSDTQTDGPARKDRRKPSRKEKLGSCCRAAASWSNELKLKDKHFNNIEPGEQRAAATTTCN